MTLLTVGKTEEFLPLRVALLSLLERTPVNRSQLDHSLAEVAEPRGELYVAGRSVIRHQFSLALAMGCARIIVLSETLDGELPALRDLAEQQGVQINVISTARALLSLVAPEDDLVVLSDGLLALPEELLLRVEEGYGVYVLPIETGLAAGFERIDINHASSGLMRLPGRIVAGLGDLPGDWDAASALLRLAIQAGVRQVPVPAALVETGRWTTVRSETDALAIEPRWLRFHTASDHGRSPGKWLAATLVHWLGPVVLNAGTRPAVLSLAAVLIAALGAGAGWFGFAALGFLLLGSGWLIRQTAVLLSRIEGGSAEQPTASTAAFLWGGDLLFVLIASWRSDLPTGQGIPAGFALFVPFVLFALLHLVPRMVPENAQVRALFADRLVVGIVMAVLSISAPFDVALMVVVILLLLTGLILPGFIRAAAPNRALTKAE